MHALDAQKGGRGRRHRLRVACRSSLGIELGLGTRVSDRADGDAHCISGDGFDCLDTGIPSAPGQS